MYEALARRLSAAEAAQRLRLPEGASHSPDGAQEEPRGRTSGFVESDEEHSAHHMLGVRPEELLRSQLDEGPFSQVRYAVVSSSREDCLEGACVCWSMF